MPEVSETKKISELTRIQNNSQGIPNLNSASLIEISEPQDNGRTYESKSMTVEQLKKFIFEKTFPVGSIFISTNGENPNSLFGGTWERFAQGKTIFGVDTNKGNFNWSSKRQNNSETLNTGGSDTLQLDNNSMPQHTHTVTLANKINNGAIEFAIRHPYNSDPSKPDQVTPSVYVPNGKGFVTKSAAPTVSINKTWTSGTVTKTQPSDAAKKADVASVTMPEISTTATLSNVGSGKAVYLYPPYVVCYIWRRTG